MEPADLFRPPVASLGVAPPADDEGESLPGAIVADLVAARSGMRVFAGLGALTSLGLAAAAFLIPNVPTSAKLGMLTAAVFIDILVMLLVKTAAGIGSVERIPTTKRFEDTLVAMSGLWRLAGIMLGVVVAIYFFVLFVAQQFMGSL